MSYAQKGRVLTVTASEADSSKGAETDYQYIPNAGGFTSQYDLTIQVLATQLGGTSDGTISLEGSVDGTSYAAIDNTVFTATDDSLTITNGAVWVVNIPITRHYKYRLKIAGTASDTTLLTTKYLYKDVE